MNSNKSLLLAVKMAHTIIFFIESAAIMVIVFCGLFNIHNTVLWIAVGLVMLETVVFLGNGQRCPMTAWAKALGDPTGDDFVADIFLPDWFVPHVTSICGTTAFVGMLLVVVQMLR